MKDGTRKGQIGAGWINPDGSINIKLDPLVVLAENPDMVIKLWPIDKEATQKKFGKKAAEASSQEPTAKPF